MPRYDYRCGSCEHEFELIQSFKDAGSGVCPACSGEGQRVYHAVPVIYKGSGFYTTDYGRPKPPTESTAKESKSNSEGKPSTSETSSTSSSESTSDSKSKATTESAT